MHPPLVTEKEILTVSKRRVMAKSLEWVSAFSRIYSQTVIVLFI